MNLYITTLFGVRFTVTAHNGLLDVYSDALRAMASCVSQLPRVETFPELLMGNRVSARGVSR